MEQGTALLGGEPLGALRSRRTGKRRVVVACLVAVALVSACLQADCTTFEGGCVGVDMPRKDSDRA